MMGKARQEVHDSRENLLQAKWHFDKVDLNGIMATPITAKGTTLGPRTDAWRAASHIYYSLMLAKSGAHNDWLSPFVDIRSALRDPYWRDFWLVDVEAERLPRAWIRWALKLLHSLRRVNDGTPCDTQLGTYLVSCTHFVTADQRYADVIEKCRDKAPIHIARVVRIPAGVKGVDALIELMSSVKTHRRSHQT